MIIQHRGVGHFNRIQFRGPGNLEVLLGDVNSVRIEATSQHLDAVVSEVTSGTLQLGLTHRDVIDLSAYQDVINYRVTLKELRGLTVSHHGCATVPDLDTDELSIKVCGHGSLTLNQLTADHLQVSLTDAARLEVNGDVEYQTVSISGRAELKADALVSDHAEVRLTGTSAAEVRVNDELTSYVGESARLTYVGYPEVEKYGAGTLVRRRKSPITSRGTEHG